MDPTTIDNLVGGNDPEKNHCQCHQAIADLLEAIRQLRAKVAQIRMYQIQNTPRLRAGSVRG